jgi:hypothetical protein
MPRSIAFALGILFATLVSSPVTAFQDHEQRLIGKWSGDPVKTREYLKIPEDTAEGDDEVRAFLRVASNVSVEFVADHKLIALEGENEPMNGTWEFVKERDGALEILMIRDEEETPATIKFVDENSIAISVNNERAIVFVRQTEAEPQGIITKLHGRWHFDKQASMSLESNAEFGKDQIDQMLQQVADAKLMIKEDGSIEVEIVADGEVRQIQGTWTSSNVDEEKHTFDLAMEVEGGPGALTGRFLESGMLQLGPPNQPAAVFSRPAAENEKDR